MGAKKFVNREYIQRVLFIPIAIIAIISGILVFLVISGSINIQKYSFFRSESEKQAQVQFNNKLQLQVTSINHNLDTIQSFMIKNFEDLKDQKDSTLNLISEFNEQKKMMLNLTSDLRHQKNQIHTFTDKFNEQNELIVNVTGGIKKQEDLIQSLTSHLNNQLEWQEVYKKKFMKIVDDLNNKFDENKNQNEVYKKTFMKTVDDFNNKFDEKNNQILSLNDQLKEQKILITKIANKAAISTEATFLNWKLFCGILLVFFSNHFFT
ncbi:interaptin-like [Hydra vulgaris]|uniref:Interaptin-like n=1 Tax=Hydra vulgaris TaxID=6087 RepID=A0ABM4C4U8_HYDVU